jgi:hypothetical protein
MEQWKRGANNFTGLDWMKSKNEEEFKMEAEAKGVEAKGAWFGGYWIFFIFLILILLLFIN